MNRNHIEIAASLTGEVLAMIKDFLICAFLMIPACFIAFGSWIFTVDENEITFDSAGPMTQPSKQEFDS